MVRGYLHSLQPTINNKVLNTAKPTCGFDGQRLINRSEFGNESGVRWCESGVRWCETGVRYQSGGLPQAEG